MADEITQADVDKAIKEALAAAKAEWEGEKETELAGLKKKNQELLNKVRAAGDISPEDLAKVEAERDKAQGDLAEANKQLKALTAERDKAVKALETEQTAARTYAMDAEISGAIAAGNVLPALVPAFKAFLRETAKADLVDGKYAVTIGEKPAGEYIKAFLDSEDGKAYRQAAANGGGGAPGGGGTGGGKTVTRAVWDTMSHPERATFAKDGGKVVDQAA